jgi:hypothetical protein
MDTITAFELGEQNRDKPRKVFDWNKAAALIRILEIKEAWAGLSEDWAFTGGQIFKDGKPYTEDYTYLASTWATPVLITALGTVVECWCWDYECDWGAHTKWPEIARIYVEDTNGKIS